MLTRAIYISAGLGDSLLTLPLARRLRPVSRRLVALVTSPMMTRSFLQHLNLFDRIDFLTFKNVKKSWDWGLLPYALRHFRRYDEVYLPPFSVNRAHQYLASLLAKRLCYHPDHAQLPVIHDAIQNMRLYDPSKTSPQLSSSDITFPPDVIERIVKGRLPASLESSKPFVAVQISANDSVLPQKSWPFEHWEAWLRAVVEQQPAQNFVLIGGSRETLLMEQMMAKGLPRVTFVNTSGSLESACAVLHTAQHFVGLDGGLMHLAACLGKPTFTLWGASNPQLYGYEQMDPCRHRVVSLKMPCGPCESWLHPNQTRVTVARECPDFCCLRSLSPDMVIDQYLKFCRG